MKKFLSLLALAAGGCLMAQAQTLYSVSSTDTKSEALETGIYAISVNSSSTNFGSTTRTNERFLYRKNYAAFVDEYTVTDHQYMGQHISNTAYLWEVTKNTDGKITLKNVESGTYIQSTTASNTKLNLSASAMSYTMQAATLDSYKGSTILFQSDYSYYITNQINEETGKNSRLGCQAFKKDKDITAHFKFYKATKVEAETAVSCTLNFTDTDGSTMYTTTVTLPEGFDMTTLPAVATPLHSHYYTFGQCTESDKKVSSANATFTYPVTTGTVPFTFSTDTDKTWYTARLNNTTEGGANSYLVRVSDENKGIKTSDSPFTTSSVTSKDDFSNGLWAFVKDGLGVKLLSKAANKYVTMNADTYNGNKINVNLGKGTTYYTAKGSDAADFALTYAGTGSLGDYKDGFLGVWNGGSNFEKSKSDEASGFKITPADSDAVLSIGKHVYNADADAMVSGTDEDGYLLGPSASDIQDLKTRINAATTVATLEAAWGDGTLVVHPEADTYYRIESAGDMSNKFLSSAKVITDTKGDVPSSEASDRTIVRDTENDALVPQLWKFEKSGDGFYLVNANVGLKVGQLKSGTQTGLIVPITSAQTAGNLGVFTVSPTGTKAVFNILGDGHYLSAKNESEDSALGAQDGKGSTATRNQWKIQAISTVPVTVSSVGWASVCLPCDVTLPEGTQAKAFKATAATATKLTLEEIKGTIPAKTGFLLSLSGGGKVDFAISKDGSAEVSGNILDGATAKRIGFATGGSNYFLAVDKGKAILMQAADDFTVVPANKAYLPAARIQSTTEGSATKLVFDLIEDSTTGISAAQSESDRAVKYYDLSGRRVLYPAHGIFVTDKGEKVLLR